MTEGKQIYYHRLRENSRKMNPRLKELAVEAGAYLDNGAILHGPMDVAKFTELIIKDCGVALNPMLRDMVSRGQAYDLIKQHFGVEE